LPFKFPGNFFVLLREHLSAAQGIERAVLCRCHQPRPGIFRDAVFGPSLEGRNERVLGEFLCDADIAGDACNRGDETCGFDLPHGLNRLGDIAHAEVYCPVASRLPD
jgi:hypothetical protein